MGLAGMNLSISFSKNLERILWTVNPFIRAKYLLLIKAISLLAYIGYLVDDIVLRASGDISLPERGMVLSPGKKF